MKILILKPSSLGDVVQALPVLRMLKRHLPDSAIYWWLDSHLAPLLTGDPDVTGLFSFQRHGWSTGARWWAALQNLRRMRQMRFDWVIDLQALARSAVVAWLTHGRFTIGLDDRREGASAMYDRVVPRCSFYTHAVDWYLDVLRVLEVPVRWDFEWLPRHDGITREVSRRFLPGGGPWIALCPGARWPNKRWPRESFVELVRRLAASIPEVRFFVIGHDGEQEVGEALARVASGRVRNLVGWTNLPELIECLRSAQLIVTNDSGPMHIAAALRRPVVALFGPTEPRRTGPYGRGHSVLRVPLPCAPCLHRRCAYHLPFECLRGLQPETVARVVHQRWQERMRDSTPLRI